MSRAVKSYRPQSAPDPPRQHWFDTSRKYIYIRNNSKYPVMIVVSSNPESSFKKIKQIGASVGPIGAQIEFYEHHKDIISFKAFGTYKTGRIHVNSPSFFVSTFICLEDGNYVQIKKEPCERSDYEYIIDNDDIVVNFNDEIIGNNITVIKEINKIELLS